MATYEKPFLCRVQTLEGQALSTEALSVIFPAADGQAGVLGRCGPIASALGAGPLVVVKPDGQCVEYFVAGGFAHVRDDVVTILAQECLPADQLDVDGARGQLEEARAMPSRPAPASDAREEALRAARARLRLAEKRGRQTA
jgi:F-type H+-transporting ATPase subunit epsilon